MLAFAFKRICQLHQFRLILGGNCDRIRHPRLSLSDRSGLVKRGYLNLPGRLKRRCGLEKNTVFRSHAVPHHDGNRGRQSQCARTTDDQNRNGIGQRAADRFTGKHPADKGQKRNCHYRRNKYS